VPTLKDRAGIIGPPGHVVRADLRTRTSEHWQNLTNPQQFACCTVPGPLHYRNDPFDENEEWKDCDLTVNLTPAENWDAACETNGYQVRFWQSRAVNGSTVRMIAQFRRAGCSLTMAPRVLCWVNAAGDKQIISRPKAAITPVIDNDAGTVTWPNAFGAGLHYRYNLRPDQFYKTLVISAKANLPAPTIGTTGLRLTLVMALAWSGARPAAFGGDADGELDPDEDPSGDPDEEATDPGDYAHKRVTDAREAFWVRQPRAWDSAEEQHSIAVRCNLLRHDGHVQARLSVPASALNNAATVYPVYIDTDMAEEQVAASTDDAYSYGATWPGTPSINLTAAYVQLGSSTTNYACPGWRWTPPVPQGVTISSASVSLRANQSNAGNVTSRWYAEDVDNAATWASDHRPAVEAYAARTTASVQWAQTGITAGTWYTSSDIATIVQEIADRPGWVASNGFALVAVQTSGDLLNVLYRISSWDENSAYGAKLNVSYTVPTAGLPMDLFLRDFYRNNVGVEVY
jgi:hypothetical protein